MTIPNFSLITPGRIVFGAGVFEQAGTLSAGLGAKKALIISGPNAMVKSGHLGRLQKLLSAEGMQSELFTGVSYEASPESVDAAVACAKETGCDMVIALGGGAVLDAGKAVCGVLPNGGSIVDYLEGVGIGSQITIDPVPFIAMPTTSGTGSEATKNGVIRSESKRYKKNIRHDKLMPSIAIVDPELTCSCPAQQTAYSGMDAICQLIESYTSRNRNPATDALSLEGIRHAANALPFAVRDGSDIEARSAMSLASLFSGICLANGGLGAVHGFASPIGGMYPLRHGLVCGVLLPHIMRINLPGDIHRFCDVGEALTGKRFSTPEEGALAGVEFIEQLNAKVGVPADFKGCGISPEDADAICKASLEGSSMRNNPVQMSFEQMRSLISGLI